MTEQFRPQPENPKQNASEAGAGPLGLPPPSPEGERPRGELTPEQQIVGLDPELEKLLHAASHGDPEYEKSWLFAMFEASTWN